MGVRTFSKSPTDKDFTLLKQTLEKLPSVPEMSQMGTNQKQLKAGLDKIDTLLYPLLRWIITSNRCHLKKLDEKENVSKIPTKFQFELKSLPPLKKRNFQLLKKKHGTFYAFHGSPLANWHSILRAGLKNQSGTTKQLHGAISGSGVYLAAQSVLSISYCYSHGVAKFWDKSMFGTAGITCMSLCEVINMTGYKKLNGLTTHQGGYYVIPNDEHLSTRYFLIFVGLTINGDYSGKGSDQKNNVIADDIFKTKK